RRHRRAAGDRHRGEPARPPRLGRVAGRRGRVGIVDPSVTERYPSGPQSFPATGVNSLATVTRRWMARVLDSFLIGLPVLVIVSLVLVIRSAGDPSADAADATSTTVQAVTWAVLVAVA